MTVPQQADATSDRPPRFRYFTVAPRAMTVPTELLLAALPPDTVTGAPTHTHVTIPCADVLATNSPRVRSSRLREWLPGVVAADATLPEWITLPAARLAIHYRPETAREEIPDEKPPVIEAVNPVELPAEPVPTTESSEVAPAPAEDAPPPAPAKPTPRPIPSWKRILKPVLGPSAEELHEAYHRLRHPDPAATKPDAAPVESANSAPSLETPSQVIEASAAATTPPATPPAPEPAPPLEPPAPPLPNNVALQAIFMTDAEISHQHLTDLIAGLPGIAACALAITDDVRLSAGIPAGFDARATRKRLVPLLDQSGVNSLTLHPDGHPLSILRHAESTLLVLHRDDRPFLPGVRERLVQTLAALS